METAHLLCDSDNFEDVISTLKSEGAELERELDEARDELAELWTRFDKQMEAEAEVERLKNGFQGSCYCCEPVGEMNQKLEAEVERLRHLLTEASYRINEPAFVAEIEEALNPDKMNHETDTPRTDDRLCTISIENEDSCCAIYVKIDGKDSDCDLIDADFTRQLERELTQSKAEVERLKEEVKNLEDIIDDIMDKL